MMTSAMPTAVFTAVLIGSRSTTNGECRQENLHVSSGASRAPGAEINPPPRARGLRVGTGGGRGFRWGLTSLDCI